MTENVKEAFAVIAKQYNTNDLPADDANWDWYSHAYYGHSILAVLDHYRNSQEPLPDDVATLLALPRATTYAIAVERIEITEGKLPNKYSALGKEDLVRLARSYLCDFIELDSSSFFTGDCEQRRALWCLQRFERIAELLGPESRQKIIDGEDERRGRSDGEDWQLYKYKFGGAFWTTPADLDVVFRMTDRIDEYRESEPHDECSCRFVRALELALTHRRTGIPPKGSGADEDDPERVVFIREFDLGPLKIDRWDIPQDEMEGAR